MVWLNIEKKKNNTLKKRNYLIIRHTIIDYFVQKIILKKNWQTEKTLMYLLQNWVPTYNLIIIIKTAYALSSTKTKIKKITIKRDAKRRWNPRRGNKRDCSFRYNFVVESSGYPESHKKGTGAASFLSARKVELN